MIPSAAILVPPPDPLRGRMLPDEALPVAAAVARPGGRVLLIAHPSALPGDRTEGESAGMSPGPALLPGLTVRLVHEPRRDRWTARAVAELRRWEARHGRADILQVDDGCDPALLPRPADVVRVTDGTVRRRLELATTAAPAGLWGLAERWAVWRRMRGAIAAEQATAAGGARLLCATHAQAAQFRQWYGVAGDRITVLPTVPDLSAWPEARRGAMRLAARAELGLADREAAILVPVAGPAVDRWGAVLRTAELVRAEAARAPRPERFRFLIVAPTGVRQEMEAGRRDRSLPVSVHGPGELSRLLPAADVATGLSAHDPVSEVLTAAALWPMPVVATAGSGVAELLADGASGWVLGPAGTTDAEALAAAAAERVVRMFEGVRRFRFRQELAPLAAELTPDRTAEAWLGLWGRVLADRRRAEACPMTDTSPVRPMQ